MLQIDKDVRRLCPDLTFFQQATAHPNPILLQEGHQEKLYTRVTMAQLESQEVSRKGVGPSKLLSNSKRRQVEDYTPIMEAGQEAHWEVVQRLLFLYAKLNPGKCTKE